MANVLGEPGRYVNQEAVRKRREIWQTTFWTVAAGMWISGLLIGGLLPWHNHRWALLLLSAFCPVFAFFHGKRALRKMDSLERDRLKWIKGAEGEEKVAIKLDDLSDEYTVIHDLKTNLKTTDSENLDHVVVGPTGVFVLDSKNCRGIVANDRNGGLLLNDNPKDAPHARQFVSRIMGIRDKVMVLTENHYPNLFFRPVFVFTSAWVEADFGTTGPLHCVRDDKLNEYILDERYGSQLKTSDVNKLARAFQLLAQMDTDFGNKTHTRE